MAERMTLSASNSTKERLPRGTYYLATTERVLRFYCFSRPPIDPANPYTIIDRLDTNRLLGAKGKAAAKQDALMLGLTTWQYVRVG